MTLQNRKSVSELEFENEIQNNDLVIIFQLRTVPQSEEELLVTPFSLGIIRKNPSGNSFNVYYGNTFEKDFMSSVFCIGNLTTLKREYIIFSKLPDVLLLDYILNPKEAKSQYEPPQSQKFMALCNNKYNDTQYKALSGVFSTSEGLYLIQGPPGTGKTTLILGIISGFISCSNNFKPKIMVCAPSNGAVDEIASRAHKNGLFDEDGGILSDISLLRIGQKKFKNELGVSESKDTKNIPHSVKDISLNYLVENRLELDGHIDPSRAITETIIEISKINKEINIILMKGQSQRQLSDKQKEINYLEIQLKELKDELKNYHELRSKIRKEFIDEANIIFCTTSTAGSIDILKTPRKYDYLIIDEACQTVELNSLIPFILNTSTVVLIGDPKQLPATVFSDDSKNNNYNRSLFERFVDCGVKPIMLNLQYRMTSEICNYPSSRFYDKKLKSHRSVDRRKIPADIPIGLLFINLKHSQEEKDSNEFSYYNSLEAKFIVNMLIGPNGNSIGIITPYKKQVDKIKELLNKKFRNDWKQRIEVNSVDGFQGREKDCIIISLVRSNNHEANIGFLKDVRRMNVALTRAKFGLSIVGNSRTLESNKDWSDFLDYCAFNNKYVDEDFGNNFHQIRRNRPR